MKPHPHKPTTNPQPSQRAGSLALTAGSFLASTWFGMFVIYAFFGFNPGGSPRKDALFLPAFILWSVLMLLMLGYSLYYSRDRRRRASWLTTLVLILTCPIWFPLAFALLIELVSSFV